MPTELLNFHFYVNVRKRILVDANGDKLGGDALMEFFREEQGVLQFTCVDDDLAAVPFPAAAAFEFGATRDYDQETDPDLLSEDGEFNDPADWDSVSVIGGKVCCRYNTTTTPFEDVWDANDASVSAGMYLRICTDIAADEWLTLFDHSCRYRNIRRANSGTPAGVTTPTYVTVDQLRAYWAQQYQGVWSSLTTYSAGQIVTHEGGAYIALLASTNQEPDPAGTAYWGYLAGVGDAADVPYTPTTGADWTDPDPADVETALDDLATRVVAIEAATYSPFDAIAATGLTAGKVYRYDGTTWTLADPDDDITEYCELWLALSPTLAVAASLATLPVTGDVGDILWLDDDGAPTSTTPDATSDAGRAARPVGWIRSATTIRFDGHVSSVHFEEAASS